MEGLKLNLQGGLNNLLKGLTATEGIELLTPRPRPPERKKPEPYLEQPIQGPPVPKRLMGPSKRVYFTPDGKEPPYGPPVPERLRRSGQPAPAGLGGAFRNPFTQIDPLPEFSMTEDSTVDPLPKFSMEQGSGAGSRGVASGSRGAAQQPMTGRPGAPLLGSTAPVANPNVMKVGQKSYWESNPEIKAAAEEGPRAGEAGYAGRADIQAWMEAQNKTESGRAMVQQFLEKERAAGRLPEQQASGFDAPAEIPAQETFRLAGANRLANVLGAEISPADNEAFGQETAPGMDAFDPANRAALTNDFGPDEAFTPVSQSLVDFEPQTNLTGPVEVDDQDVFARMAGSDPRFKNLNFAKRYRR